MTPPASSPTIAVAPAGPYLALLQPEDQEIYQATSGNLDLTEEIRLMRTVLARLAAHILANKQAISAVFGALVRAAAFQASQSGEGDTVEVELVTASEQVLKVKEAGPASLDEEEA